MGAFVAETGNDMRGRILVINAHARRTVPRKTVEKLVRKIAQAERVGVRELSIVFVDDRKIRNLNKTYLAHNGVTDVISFPLQEGSDLEGEVYVNLDQAARQAREYGVGAREEIHRLVTHGILHLIGYDDRTKKQQHTIHSREDIYLKWINRSS